MIHLLIHFRCEILPQEISLNPPLEDHVEISATFRAFLSLAPANLPTKHLKQTPNKKHRFFWWVNGRRRVCFFLGVGGLMIFDLRYQLLEIELISKWIQFHIKLESSVLGDQLIFFEQPEKIDKHYLDLPIDQSGVSLYHPCPTKSGGSEGLSKIRPLTLPQIEQMFDG